MQDLDPGVMLAVFLEMMGVWFWILGALALCGLTSFSWIIVRERGLSSGRLVRSQAYALLAGAAALVLMAHVTKSGFTDAGGPIDWLLIVAIFAGGWIGGTILIYALAGWWRFMPGRERLTALIPRLRPQLRA